MTTPPALPPKRWLLPPPTAGHRLPADLPSPAVQLLLSRNIGDAKALERFLNPTGLPHSAHLLAGVADALPRLAAAVRNGETVAVFGDFDVDGISGTAILTETLTRLGARVIPYLPHPVAEGHGMTPEAVGRLVAQGATLILTVDCGISNAVEVAHAQRSGADVIITDHHTPPAESPDAIAIVNPRMPGNVYPFPELCGAGIAYKLATALLDYLGEPPDLSLQELAALGTIADLVPLRDENRYLVQQGLATLSHTRRPGLRALLRRVNLDGRSLRAEDVGFRIAPRLNASGRMEHPETSLDLLLTHDSQEADRLASQLEQYNTQRRDLTAHASEIAVSRILDADQVPAIIITHDDAYTPGINGLIAGRLAETFNRPAVALARADADHLVASARSPGDFNLIAAISQCHDLLVRYGGHQAAAGFTVHNDLFAQVSQRLTDIAKAHLGLFEPEPTLQIHAEGTLDELLSPELSRLCAQLEPFGKDNPTPVYLTRRARVLNAGYVGAQGQHLKLHVSSGGRTVDALRWNHPGNWPGYDTVDLVFQLAEDSYRGERRTYLRIEDLRPAV
ncbi:MAG: single-stranded-DNA-specific exonuclease RecJ [Chloroflexi bacterium]|nr:single-stranded-DNA-specific exonuclease RecJ [Chloroflexota bacterium]MYD49049.1 single-stranded-DNA-specific exonuclease RecJ [Chloroflexota bacterium]